MAQSLMLPAAVLIIGLVAALFFTRPLHLQDKAYASTAKVEAD
jgi:hypothetical protein